MTRKPPAKESAERRPARRRQRLAATGDGHKLSRPLVVALLVIIVGGGYLFWPRGGDVPLGIGEQYSVVTADTTRHQSPRSGSVELDGQQQDLVPETPDDTPPPTRTPEPAVADPEPAAGQRQDPPAPREESRPARERTVTTPPAESGPTPRLAPRSRGPWALQLGAYGARENAERYVARMADKGIAAHVRTANTSGGDIVFRVWVGWFDSRAEAVAYADQERERLGEAYPVHR